MAERRELTTHFNLSEFHCKDGTEVPESHEAALKYLCEKVLEPMRKRYGPCKVHSAYRTRSHNSRIGGARASFHIYDEHSRKEVAVDVSFARGNPAKWRRSAAYRLRRAYGPRGRRGGIGYYPRGGFIHIDTRQSGPARWDGP